MSGVNKIVRSVSPKSVFESAKDVISSAVSFVQGDLLVFTGGLLALPAAEADGATFLGVARCDLVSGKLRSPYIGTAVDAAQAITDVPGPQYGVVAKVVAKTGDAFAPGASVFLNPAGGTRHVQAAGTKAVGVYVGANVASASANQEIEVMIGCRYPADVLSF